jgi:hypothetical protein
MSAFGHYAHDVQEEGKPREIHCYHKACLEKLEAFATAMKIDACCIGCTKNIGNIHEFLAERSWKEKVSSTVNFMFGYENSLLSTLKGVHFDKINSWNITSELYSIGTGAAVGAAFGAFRGTLEEIAASHHEEREVQYQAIVFNALSGAFVGAQNATVMVFATRVTVLVVSPAVALVADESATTGAALSGGQMRSVFGALVLSAGSIAAQERLHLTTLLRIGAVTGSTIVVLGAGLGKIIYTSKDELVQKLTTKVVVNPLDIELQKMRNEFADYDEILGHIASQV